MTTTPATPKTYTLTGPDDVAVTLDLPKLALHVVDMLIGDQIANNPAVARYQRVQKLCDVGNVINHLFSVSIEDAQPLDEDGLGLGLGYAGLGYGFPAIQPLGVNRRYAGQQGDTAELMRTLIALAQRQFGGAAPVPAAAETQPPPAVVPVVPDPVACPLDPGGIHTFGDDGRCVSPGCGYTIPF
jgi:hypothetical protein